MKRSFRATLVVVASIALLSAGTLVNNKYILSNGYVVTIHGTSNLHPWDERVETVTGKGIIDWNTDGTFNLSAMTIVMAVRSIKSTEGRIMNNNTYKALKSNEHPDITFALNAPLRSATTNGHAVAARINLSIAGVTKVVDMAVTATSTAHRSVTFEGSKAIKMTDYGIAPPRALMGTLKTGDEITIHFKTVFVINDK